MDGLIGNPPADDVLCDPTRYYREKQRERVRERERLEGSREPTPPRIDGLAWAQQRAAEWVLGTSAPPTCADIDLFLRSAPDSIRHAIMTAFEIAARGGG